MAENSTSSPVFADRYRFEPVLNNWDTGRTGYTYLVRDLEKNRLGVIKRADIISKKAQEDLRNEVIALKALKGQGVPNVYETGQANYESNKYEYVVIEYISSLRIEDNLNSLSASDRIEILTQFFGILDKSHRMGIVNGDVDLKHLFWDGNKKRLIVIDWGNARLITDPRKTTEYSYDLARSAEIIHSLVTLRGHPPSTGSLALPNDSLLRFDLLPLPDEFKALCKWAYRTPVDGIQSPFTAQELLGAAQNWRPGKKHLSEKPNQRYRSQAIIAFLMFVFTTIAFWIFLPSLIGISNLMPTTTSSTSTPASTFTATTGSITQTPSPTATLILTPESPSPTTTLESQITPLPNSNKNLGFVFNQIALPATHPSSTSCWSNYENLKETKNHLDGFSRRDDTNWRFNIEQNSDPNRYIRADFTKCLTNREISAFAMNILVSKMEIPRESSGSTDADNAGKGVGFFIDGENNTRREYTIWVDQTGSMHLRVREDQKTIIENGIFIVSPENLNIRSVFPRMYANFPIQIYLEINNQGLDILYLREGSGQKTVDYQTLDPNQMIRIDNAVRLSLSDINSFGLIGYGREIQTIIWPLVFFSK